MNHILSISIALLLVLAISLTAAQEKQPSWLKTAQTALAQELTAKYGDTQKARIEHGLAQVAALWRDGDGDEKVFEEFVRTNFAGDQKTLDVMFDRFSLLFEQLFGRLSEINREFRNQSDLDLGPIYPFDEVFGAYDPGAHVADDFFQNKIAFIVLLNFQQTTLEERLNDGDRKSTRLNSSHRNLS
jgi:hypothetical protein